MCRRSQRGGESSGGDKQEDEGAQEKARVLTSMVTLARGFCQWPWISWTMLLYASRDTSKAEQPAWSVVDALRHAFWREGREGSKARG